MFGARSARKGPGDAHLVVRVRRPGQRRRHLLLGTVLVLAVGWGLVQLGVYYGVDRVGRLERQLESVERQLQIAKVENDALHQEVVQARQASQLDKDAMSEVNGSVRSLEQRNAKLQEELSFLRGIMDPAEAQSGLQVRELVLEPGEAAGRYRFSLILAQGGRHDRPTQGRAELKVKGSAGGKERTLSGKDLAMDGALKFRFRFFQTLNGEFGLPEGFKPESVWVEAGTGAKGEEPQKKVFPWPLEEEVHAGQ